MPSVYLDTNEVIRLFQRDPTAERLFADAVASGRVSLVLSEAVVFEFVAGVDGGTPVDVVRNGLAKIERLEPNWILLGPPHHSLHEMEVRQAAADHTNGVPFQRVTPPLLTWAKASEVLARAIRAPPPPTLSRVLDDYVRGDVRGRVDRWDREQDDRAQFLRGNHEVMPTTTNLRDLTRRFFRGTMRKNFEEYGNLPPAEADALAATLWDRPDVCPGTRLNIEVTAALLRDPGRRWDPNTYVDHRHAMVVPYVDAFVTQERAIRAAIGSFDAAAREPAGLPPLSPGVHARIEDVPTIATC
jgi:hypothetical protein